MFDKRELKDVGFRKTAERQPRDRQGGHRGRVYAKLFPFDESMEPKCKVRGAPE